MRLQRRHFNTARDRRQALALRARGGQIRGAGLQIHRRRRELRPGLYLPLPACAALREKAVTDGLAKLGFEAVGNSPTVFARELQQEREGWAPIVKASGFSSDD